jgi:hypothetical protein
LFPPAPHGDDGHPEGVRLRGAPAGASGTSDATAVDLASDEAMFVQGTVIDVDDARINVTVIAGA